MYNEHNVYGHNGRDWSLHKARREVGWKGPKGECDGPVLFSEAESEGND